MIKEISSENELKNSVMVIRDSFRTVAIEFKLNKKNCPTHPSFVTIGQLNELKRKGTMFFGLFVDNLYVGFVAVEKGNENTYYMEKLAVLQEHRHKGYGRELVEFVFDYVRRNKGKILSIGIINEHEVLKNWYMAMVSGKLVLRSLNIYLSLYVSWKRPFLNKKHNFLAVLSSNPMVEQVVR